MKKSILRTITKDALINWDYDHETMEEKEKAAEERLATIENPEIGEPIYNDVVNGSVESAIRGLKEVLKLDDEMVKKLREDIVTKNEVSPEVAEKLHNLFSNEKLLDVLSLIHDGWVKENGNKFEGRPKNYQFVQLELLPFEEAVADLLFIKPILEAAGIQVDMERLEKDFSRRQKKFILKNGIRSTEDLKEKIQSGAEFYPALAGVKTNKGNKEGPDYEITELLKDDTISSKMAKQIEDKAKLVYTEGAYIKTLSMIKEHFLELEHLRTFTRRSFKNQENRIIFALSGNVAYFYDEARNPETERSYGYRVLVSEPVPGKRISPTEMADPFRQDDWLPKAKSIWQLRGDYQDGFQFQKIVGDHPEIMYELDGDGTVKVITYDKNERKVRNISFEEFQKIMGGVLDKIFKKQELDDRGIDE